MAALLFAAVSGNAAAQIYQRSPQGTPYPAPQSAAPGPACARLEAQLSMVDRGAADPARADQIRRLEEATQRQQFDLDRVVAQSRRQGCEGIGFFSLFGGQSQQCGQLNTEIQRMRANLDRMQSDLQRQQGNPEERAGQRRAILIALAQNNCGPQYAAAAQNAQPRNMFDALFGPGAVLNPGGATPGSTYRTVCVRTCDGYFFPISFATSPSRFPEDEQACQRQCPAAQVSLYTYRNPGEDLGQAVSISGQRYADLPTAFQYRKEFNAACSCKPPGQNWAQALKQSDDPTLEQGDIVVTQERAKQLSQAPKNKPTSRDPRAKPDARTDARTDPGAVPAAIDAPGESKIEPKRNVRSVGPTFVPAQ